MRDIKLSKIKAPEWAFYTAVAVTATLHHWAQLKIGMNGIWLLVLSAFMAGMALVAYRGPKNKIPVFGLSVRPSPQLIAAHAVLDGKQNLKHYNISSAIFEAAYILGLFLVFFGWLMPRFAPMLFDFVLMLFAMGGIYALFLRATHREAVAMSRKLVWDMEAAGVNMSSERSVQRWLDNYVHTVQQKREARQAKKQAKAQAAMDAGVAAVTEAVEDVGNEDVEHTANGGQVIYLPAPKAVQRKEVESKVEAEIIGDWDDRQSETETEDAGKDAGILVDGEEVKR